MASRKNTTNHTTNGEEIIPSEAPAASAERVIGAPPPVPSSATGSPNEKTEPWPAPRERRNDVVRVLTKNIGKFSNFTKQRELAERIAWFEAEAFARSTCPKQYLELAKQAIYSVSQYAKSRAVRNEMAEMATSLAPAGTPSHNTAMNCWYARKCSSALFNFGMRILPGRRESFQRSQNVVPGTAEGEPVLNRAQSPSLGRPIGQVQRETESSRNSSAREVRTQANSTRQGEEPAVHGVAPSHSRPPLPPSSAKSGAHRRRIPRATSQPRLTSSREMKKAARTHSRRSTAVKPPPNTGTAGAELSANRPLHGGQGGATGKLSRPHSKNHEQTLPQHVSNAPQKNPTQSEQHSQLKYGRAPAPALLTPQNVENQFLCQFLDESVPLEAVPHLPPGGMSVLDDFREAELRIDQFIPVFTSEGGQTSCWYGEPERLMQAERQYMQRRVQIGAIAPAAAGAREGRASQPAQETQNSARGSENPSLPFSYLPTDSAEYLGQVQNVLDLPELEIASQCFGESHCGVQAEVRGDRDVALSAEELLGISPVAVQGLGGERHVLPGSLRNETPGPGTSSAGLKRKMSELDNALGLSSENVRTDEDGTGCGGAGGQSAKRQRVSETQNAEDEAGDPLFVEGALADQGDGVVINFGLDPSSTVDAREISDAPGDGGRLMGPKTGTGRNNGQNDER